MLRTAETKKGKVLPKGLARSGSGLGALASLHDPHQDLCSPENTFGSPLEACLDCVDQQDELSFQVELTNCPSPAEPVIVPSVNSSIIVDQNCTSNEPLEEDLGDDMAVGLKDLQYDHPEPSNDSDRIMAKVEVEGEKQNAHAKDAHAPIPAWRASRIAMEK
ncbi:uncharacterized protein [Physcomitrium patens]|uniref:uncharacterized protein isoform X2 n=1 Tax=Physcomitrium patens TaxID=3218 RepID=UPI003CCDECDE